MFFKIRYIPTFLRAIILAVFIFFVNFVPANASTILYSHEFDGTSVFPDSRWSTEANGGTWILDSSGSGNLNLFTSQPNRYPLLVADLSDILADDYELTVAFKYNSGVVSQGAGIVVSDLLPVNGVIEPDDLEYKRFIVWTYTNGNIALAHRMCPLDNPGCVPTQQLFAPVLSFLEPHLLKITHTGESYRMYFDETLLIETAPGPDMKYLWLGNPVFTGNNQTWPNLNIDYIRVIAPEPPEEPIGEFELPFDYEGRGNSSSEQFRSAFWNRMTATFDHQLATGIHRPFSGQTFLGDCLISTPMSCYDTHNGVDFSDNDGPNALAVAGGSVVYASDHIGDTCTPEKGGYGCVVILQHSNGVYTLYAHLKKISAEIGDLLNVNSLIGLMGNTGCTGCGEHLHFGVLSPNFESISSATRKMKKSDWRAILAAAKPAAEPKKQKVFCSYKAPNGLSFSFQDPSSWFGDDQDPWSLPKGQGGCGIEPEYRWKWPVLVE